MNSYRLSTTACLVWLISASSPSHAFTSFSTASKAKLEKVGSSVMLSSQNNYNNNGYNDYDSNNNNGGQRQFRMVKQFNGDFKAVPYYEGDNMDRNPAAESEMRRIEMMNRRQPPLTSPARALMDKQWGWERPGDRPKPRLRQVRTFSGDMKTISYDDYDPSFDHRVTNAQFGRVDGTGYVPDISPDDRRMMPPPPPMMPPPPSRRPQYDPRRQPPPPPPRRQQGGMSPQRRREMERFQAKLVGEEFRREMRKFRRDENDFDPRRNRYDFDDDDDGDYESRYNRNEPLKNLAKGTEKFLKQLTGMGRSQYRPSNPRKRYRMAPPERRQSNFGWFQQGRYRNAGNLRPADEFGSKAGSFNSSPAIRSFEEQDPIPPPSYYGTNRGDAYYGRGRRSSGPRYRMERQFSGEYKSVPVYDDDDDEDNFYNNRAANSEVGRIW